jgi:5'-methylthioadenosine phosphorylase
VSEKKKAGVPCPSCGNLKKAPAGYSGFAALGGSGAYAIVLERIGKPAGILKSNTPFGKASPIHFIRPEGMEGVLAFMSRHGESGYRITAPDVNYRANIWALKEIGTTRIFSWSGPGAINKVFKPGDYVLPDDLIDLTTKRESTFYQGRGLGFIRQNPVFCPRLRPVIEEALKRLKKKYHDLAVYAVTEGPRLETKAEVRMIEKMGGELVGMTLAPEAFLARELEICYHPCCYVANWAEGVRESPYHAGELFEGMLEKKLKNRVENSVQGLAKIFLETARLIVSAGDLPRDCPCFSSMLRYRHSGVIGDDWHTWIVPE